VHTRTNAAQYKTVQGTRDKLRITMQEVLISAAKTPDDDFFQWMNNEIETQSARTHLYEMEIRKLKMFTEGIEALKNLKK
jgi:hypothetical protein